MRRGRSPTPEGVTEDGQSGEARPPIWDDAGFRQRVKAIAQSKGIRITVLLAEAGLSHDYLQKQVAARRIDAILMLARGLGVDPAVLLGLPYPLKRQQKLAKLVANIGAQLFLLYDEHNDNGGGPIDRKKVVDLIMSLIEDGEEKDRAI